MPTVVTAPRPEIFGGLVQQATPQARSDSPNSPTTESVLVFGANGWVAGLVCQLLQSQGQKVFGTTVRMENREQVLEVLDEYKPTMVFNCGGKTGRPNVDWCEDHREETTRSNVIGALNLADCCFMRGIHLTNFATGCIYVYDDAHVQGGHGFKETDEPNFTGSFYSYTKGLTEKLLAAYPNVLTLRLRMPVSDDLHPRNFVTKITKYEHVVDIPNSNTILHDLLPAAIALAKARDTGVYNFTNPGAISHNEVLTLYRDLIDPTFKWKNFSLEQQSGVIKAGRSNCLLDTTKLERRLAELGIPLPEIHEAYTQCFHRMKANLKYEADINGLVANEVGYRARRLCPGVKNVLITGGAGFIASYVVRKIAILYPEFNVVNVDKLDYCASLHNVEILEGRPNYTFVKADITDGDKMLQVFKQHNIDTVIHLAAQSHVDNSFGNSASFTLNNVMGTHVLLETARVHKVTRFIHVSTDEVYGEVELHVPDLNEGALLAPTNPYSASKAAAEMLVLAYQTSFGVPTIITRSNNVYGPYQYPEKVIPKFISLLSEGRKCCLHGDGSNTRRYIYASDVADAIDTILHLGSIGESYNIGTQFEISNKNLARRLVTSVVPSAAAHPDRMIEHHEDRAFNDRRYAIDGSKIAKLGWKPMVGFDDGIEKTIRWYLKNGKDWWGDVSSVLSPHPGQQSSTENSIAAIKARVQLDKVNGQGSHIMS